MRRLAAPRVCVAPTKCSSPSSSTSPNTLKTQKGGRIQTPNGGRPKEGQWSDYHINPVRWVLATRPTRSGTTKPHAHLRKGRPTECCRSRAEGVLFEYPI